MGPHEVPDPHQDPQQEVGYLVDLGADLIYPILRFHHHRYNCPDDAYVLFQSDLPYLYTINLIS